MVLWVTINSIAIVLLTFVLYLIVRQMGVILNYVGPLGARQMDAGPRIGEVVATMPEATLRGQLSLTKPTLLVFASSSCSICTVVRRACEELSRQWAEVASIILVYDGLMEPDVTSRLKIVGDAQLRATLDIDMVPYGVALDVQGKVVAKGLINNISHVESLLEQLPLVRSDTVSSHEHSTAESHHAQA